MCGGDGEVSAYGKDGSDESSRDLGSTAAEEQIDERERHIEGAVVFSFECTAFAVVNEETAESVDVPETAEVHVKAGSRGLLLNSDRDGAGVPEDGGEAERKILWGGEGPVLVKKESDLRRWMAASSMSLETPR